MPLKLTDVGRERYSRMERALFDLIRRRSGINTVELAMSYYQGDPPVNGRQIVGVALRRLTAKIKANREPFKLEQSPRSGPFATEWTLKSK
jgi:hypothetical protein